MERKEFMKSIGAGAAFAVTFGCLGGCLREELDPLNPTDQMAEVPLSPDPTVETIPEVTPTDTTTTSTTPPETIPTDTTTTTTPTTPSPEPPPANALFTIDLTTSGASKLASNGGYIIKNNIVVAKNLNGEFVAATVVCSHDILKKVIFKNNEYYCTEHGARFNQAGKGLNKDGKRGLRIYETSLTGDMLSVLA